MNNDETFTKLADACIAYKEGKMKPSEFLLYFMAAEGNYTLAVNERDSLKDNLNIAIKERDDLMTELKLEREKDHSNLLCQCHKEGQWDDSHVVFEGPGKGFAYMTGNPPRVNPTNSEESQPNK